MKVLFGGGVAEMRGSQAGTTASRNRGGAYMRQRVTPTNPNSTRQQSVRNNMTELTTAWSNDLTQAQRDAWTAFANAWPITDVFGASIVLTGLQYYVKTNTVLLQAGELRLDDAPADQNVESLTVVSATADVSDALIELAFTPDPLGANSVLQVFATPAISPGISFVKNKLRLIASITAAATSPQDVTAAWLAVFGTFPAVGQKIVLQARVMNDVNGVVSTPLSASAIVTA